MSHNDFDEQRVRFLLICNCRCFFFLLSICLSVCLSIYFSFILFPSPILFLSLISNSLFFSQPSFSFLFFLVYIFPSLLLSFSLSLVFFLSPHFSLPFPSFPFPFLALPFQVAVFCGVAFVLLSWYTVFQFARRYCLCEHGGVSVSRSRPSCWHSHSRG